MKKKQIILVFVLFSTLSIFNCGVGKAIKEMGEISLAVKAEFDLENSVGVYWTNNVRSWSVTFTSYDLSDANHGDLEDLAEEVHDFLLDEFEQGEEQDYILVRFTPDDDYEEESSQKVEFRFDN